MKSDSWRAPYSGLVYFFTHPTLWGWAFLASLISFSLTLFLCVQVILWTFPASHSGGAVFLWHLLQSFGWGLLTLILMIAIVFPLIFNFCFARAFCNILKKEHIYHTGPNAAALSSFWVFFRTLKWRILWPLLLLLSILFLPPLIFPLALLAANHLAVIESADLALSLFGMSGKERVAWLQQHGTSCFAFAISGSILSFLLSLTGVGWILWIPAIYCGAFLWIRSSSQKT